MSGPGPSLESLALAVLGAASPPDKIRAAQCAAAGSQAGAKPDLLGRSPPQRPARPDRPVLSEPGRMARRRLGSPAGRIALLHAIAHIEFNAIDLAFDMAARFAGAIDLLGLDAEAFIADWFAVGADEARHFQMIETRLQALGSAYGALKAHDGLWEAAERTAGDVAARLVVAPLILEARGLDVTPGMIERLRAEGDEDSAGVLQIIYREEIGHVACGKRWFEAVCERLNENPHEAFHSLKSLYFPGSLKPPFNHEAREKAGLERALYDLN